MTPDSLFSLHEHVDCAELRLQDPRQCDSLITSEFGDQLNDFCERHAPERIVVNFDQATSVSASIIGALVALRNRVRLCGSELNLCGMNDRIRHVFRLLHLDGGIFEIRDGMSEAAATFTEPVTREHG